MTAATHSRPVTIACRRLPDTPREYDARIPRDHFLCIRCGRRVVVNLDPDHAVVARRAV